MTTTQLFAFATETRAPYPWKPFTGRFDPTRPNATEPTMKSGPGYSARWIRLMEWDIERSGEYDGNDGRDAWEEWHRRMRWAKTIPRRYKGGTVGMMRWDRLTAFGLDPRTHNDDRTPKTNQD